MSKVVVIEDNTLMARIYETKLVKEGHFVGLAFDGQTGLNMIRTTKPDLALIDLNLPVLSGIEVIKQLRAQQCFFDLPVIAYSADENLLQAVMPYRPLTTFSKTELSLKEVVEAFRNALQFAENLKLAENSPLSPADEAANAENPFGGLPKILIADDDPTIALIVRQTIESMGFQAVVAVDGREAQRILAKNSDFAAVICDVEMPYLKGTEVVKYMRTKKELADIPAMIMTSEQNMKIYSQEFAAGAVSFLPKPFTRKTLVNLLAKLIAPQI